MAWQVLVLMVLILLNGFFALSELAIVSAKRIRLEAMAEGGSQGAQRALRLAEAPTEFLSTVQVGITLIGIFTGAYGGAALSVPVAEVLGQIPLLADRANLLAFVLVVLVTTYLSLIVGELVPKRIAMQNPEAIAAAVAGPMTLVARAGRPVVWLLSQTTRLVLKALRVRDQDGTPVTEEEVRAMIAEGTSVGVFHQAEQRMLEGVIGFADRPVRAIMVPRHEIVRISAADAVADAIGTMLASSHSRFPLFVDGTDEVIGIVHAKDVLDLARRGGQDLTEVAREALFVSESMLSLRLIELFRSARTHMALVLDEYGALEGLVTPIDILAEIAGSLPERDDAPPPGAVRGEDGAWLLDGDLPINEAARVLGLERPASDDYATLAGLVLFELGHLPEPGETVEVQGWRLEVLRLERRRIAQVSARRANPQEPPSARGETDGDGREDGVRRGDA